MHIKFQIRKSGKIFKKVATTRKGFRIKMPLLFTTEQARMRAVSLQFCFSPIMWSPRSVNDAQTAFILMHFITLH